VYHSFQIFAKGIQYYLETNGGAAPALKDLILVAFCFWKKAGNALDKQSRECHTH
jgi:hypothetical protein